MPATRLRSPAWSATAAALVVLGGIAVVALASRGGPGDGTAAAYDAPHSDRFLLVGFLVAVAISTAAIVWAMWPDGRPRIGHEPVSWWRQYVLSLIVLFLVVGVGALRDRLHPQDRRERIAERTAPPAKPDDPPGVGATGPRASGTATVALAVVVVAAAGAAGLVAFARRRQSAADAGTSTTEGQGASGNPDDDAATDLEALPDDLDEDDIAAEPDPRRAVLLAYALLERRLAGTSAARQPAASPQEWLRHVVRHGDAELATTARTLTALYERARFSVRPVTAEDRAAAADALRQAQPSTSTRGRG